MKTLIIAAMAAALTTPVLAETPAEFALKHFAMDHETGDGPRIVPSAKGGEIISTKSQDVAAYAAQHLNNGQDDER